MTGSKSSRTLLIFVKQPIPGRVKTRLGKSIGHPAAAEVYKKLLHHTKQEAMKVAAQRQVWYGQAVADDDLWQAPHFTRYAQPQEDLGGRMAFAFKEAFAQGAQKVVIIGSDCPQLSASVVEQAFEVLDHDEVVLGPAADGGYYLLGLRHFYDLFNRVNWSTAQVLAQTQEKIEQNGLSFQLLPTLSDLDTLEDLKKFPEYDP